jgi:hypothetical protein
MYLSSESLTHRLGWCQVNENRKYKTICRFLAACSSHCWWARGFSSLKKFSSSAQKMKIQDGSNNGVLKEKAKRLDLLLIFAFMFSCESRRVSRYLKLYLFRITRRKFFLQTLHDKKGNKRSFWWHDMWLGRRFRDCFFFRKILLSRKNLWKLSANAFQLTPIDIQFSSCPCGNFTTNFEPAFSSESFKGRNRQTTLIESSAGISRSTAAIIALKLKLKQC